MEGTGLEEDGNWGMRRWKGKKIWERGRDQKEGGCEDGGRKRSRVRGGYWRGSGEGEREW